MTVLAGSKQQSNIVLKKLLHFHLMPKHTAERARQSLERTPGTHLQQEHTPS